MITRVASISLRESDKYILIDLTGVLLIILQVKGTGQTLFDTVIAKLRLVESDYFDLEYIDSESIPVSIYAYT